MSKENFKQFVQQHKELIHHVKNGQMTWQKFYELYDLYGESNEVWTPYFTTNEPNNTQNTSTLLGDTSLKEIFNAVKKVDLDTVKRGIDGLQKAVSLIQDLSGNKTASTSQYQRRPMYKYFED